MIYIYVLFSSLFAVWYLSGYSIWLAKKLGKDTSSGTGWKIIRWLYHEIKPFVLVIIAIATISGPYTNIHKVIDGLFYLALWWMFKDVDKDDRWKRRLEKAKEKVQVSGSKLVVVPGG